MGLYEQIKSVCKERNTPISKLEKDLGFARSSISKFNTSKPSIDKLQKIAIYFDVSLDYLLTGKENDVDPKDNISKRSEKDLMKLFGITKEQYLSQEEFIIDGEKVSRKDIEFIFDTMHSLLENVKKRNHKE